MTASVIYKGNLRCESVHVQSGSTIETDAPTDNKGKGERFSPTDSVCMALATCMITTIAIKSADKGIDFTGSKLEVTKHMLSDPRRIGSIDVILNLTTTSEPDKEGKRYYQNIADNCPVMKSLNPEILINTSYNWNS
jgi:uncharacterized OsmC-like protein